MGKGLKTTARKSGDAGEESLSGFSAHPGTVETRNFVVEVSELPELEEMSP
jgi:hypothetical protein